MSRTEECKIESKFRWLAIVEHSRCALVTSGHWD